MAGADDFHCTACRHAGQQEPAEECLSCQSILCMEHMCSHDCDAAQREMRKRIALIEAFKGGSDLALRRAYYDRWLRFAKEGRIKRALQESQAEVRLLRQQLAARPGGADMQELVRLRLQVDRLTKQVREKDDVISRLQAQVRGQSAPGGVRRHDPQAAAPAPPPVVDPDDDLL
eukprot:TRINITY_DN50493_c0_g1_i1.p2 TRINITY_DN50493_c0_g1~~TRINITY_DN50493_c0_g1_i1.p2  ORF type:complete len:199 (+),score=68.35 TRINITY_DN50493_c0_g1_i1:76-597(+)